MKNYDLIKDMELTLRVRLGTTTMMLQDVKQLDIGKVIETSQRANDPVELLYQNKVVAVGEIVVVDGNFGIQITKMKEV